MSQTGAEHLKKNIIWMPVLVGVTDIVLWETAL